MTTYFIYIKSDKHPRTINTPINARTYFDKIIAEGVEEMMRKVKELQTNGAQILEISTPLGKRIWL